MTKITEVFVETDEVIEREFTAEELVQYELDQAQEKKRLDDLKAEADAKAAQRQALLNRLGITEEEARILLGGN